MTLDPRRRFAVLLLSMVAACNGSGGDTDGGSGGGAAGGTGGGVAAAPTVVTTTPAPAATAVPLGEAIHATFSIAMDTATLTTSSFTLTSAGCAIAGAVTYANSVATFSPTAALPAATLLNATITTLAKSSAGVALASNYSWTFTTATATAHEPPVVLGGAGSFVILAKTGISTVPASVIIGNLGVSPAAATSITGFSLIADSANVFSTSTQVTGQVFAADYMAPTGSNLTTAVSDMETAFTNAAGRSPGVTELGAGSIGGMTLTQGVYKWSSGLLIATDVTLTGADTDVWVLQIAQDLTLGNAAQVHLTGGALAKNVFWQVSGAVRLGTAAHCEGVVLTQTAVTLDTGASLNGRLLAQTAVNLDGNTIVQPTPCAVGP